MDELKIGMVGLDTSHCEAFANVLNDDSNPHHVSGGRVVAAFPGGSDLCAVSRDRVGGFTEKIRDEFGVEIVDSIEELGRRADAILLHSVDGRQHLEQFQVLAQFGKPVFVDKPLACSYSDAREIVEAADQLDVPVMSASAIRYSAGVAGLAPEGSSVVSCEAFGTMGILDDYPPYFWYGVHGADVVFSYMGKGCASAQAVHRQDADLLIGVWEDGRIATVRGLRSGPYHFGCAVFTDKGTVSGLALNDPPSYALLLGPVMEFFRTGVSPIEIAETLEVMAFLEAAERSLAQGGEVFPLPR
jgi:hypothetical protein